MPGTSVLTCVRVGQPGNLAHRRPHVPSALAADRADVARTVGYPADQWHHLRQVHGDAVAVVGEDCPPGKELREVDAAVTTLSDRPLVVQVADCVPVLLAGPRAIGAAHAGRRGVHAGVVQTAVSAMAAAGDAPSALSAAIGPAIGGCCYEVPAEIQQQVGQVEPTAIAVTTWGSPSLDLPMAVHAQLERLGVTSISHVGSCTRCDPGARWFSHRGDPGAGRQVGLIVRPSLHRSPPVDRGARHAGVCA
jgi:YfiH family protein